MIEDAEIIRTGVAELQRKVFDNHETVNWDVFFDIENAAISQNIEIGRTKKAWFRCKAYPILNANNSLAFVVVQHDDISYQKLKESLLFEEKERLKVTIRNPV